MQTRTLTAVRITLLVALPGAAARGGTLHGTVKLGGIIENQTGDRSAVQETYNVYNGFSLDQLRLSGTPGQSDYLMLDLREINLDSRRADLVYRRPGFFGFNAGYDQTRQLFSPDGAVNSMRKDWKVGAQYSPLKWLDLSGNFNYLSRDGGRISFPPGTPSVLGTGYDNVLKSGQLAAQVQRGRSGGALAYDVSKFSDRLNGSADRTGQVVSARFYAPTPFYDNWTNLLRAAYGVSKLSATDIDYKLSHFQYTGVVAPVRLLEFRYNFDASRLDDQATALRTDRFQNGLDATWFHKFGQVSGGYVYETNDDDRTLTQYHSWQAGTVLRYGKYVTARVNYAGRNKNDQEDLTLLKDIESNRLRARLQVQPIEPLAVGGGYARRERECPDIRVKSDGEAANGFARYTYAGWGGLSAEYSYSNDTFRDRAGGFDSRSDIATLRGDFDRIKDLRLGSGVTYLNIGRDLDIEKWLVFVEGAYRFRNKYLIEAKYNAYNYDDYILVGRYYTANVLRMNVGYDFNLK